MEPPVCVFPLTLNQEAHNLLVVRDQLGDAMFEYMSTEVDTTTEEYDRMLYLVNLLNKSQKENDNG